MGFKYSIIYNILLTTELKWLKMCTIRVGATPQWTTSYYIQNLGLNSSWTVAGLHDNVLTFHSHLRWANEKQQWINQQVRDYQRALLPSLPEWWCHSAIKCWWLNNRLLPRLCRSVGENVCNQNHGHTLRLCVGFFSCTEWRWNKRCLGFRLTDGFKNHGLLTVSIKVWQAALMCSDRRSRHSPIDAQRTWMESPEVKKQRWHCCSWSFDKTVASNRYKKKVFHGIKYEMPSKTNFLSEIWRCML